MFLTGHSTILGVGIEHPQQRVSSAQLMQEARIKENFGIADNYLERLTGIKERRRVADGVQPSDLATAAAVKALDGARILPEDIQFLVYTGMTRDHSVEPSTAHNVQRKLNAINAHAFDISNACLGFMNGILTIDSFMASGARYGLVVTGEKGSIFTDKAISEIRKQSNPDVLFELIGGLTVGDVGAAFVLGRKQHPDHGFIGFEYTSDGRQANLCWCGDNDTFGPLHTDMPSILREGTRVGGKTFKLLQSELGWSIEDLDWYIPHQVGKISFRVNEDTTGVSKEKMPDTCTQYGNLTTGTIPVCIR